MGDDILQYVEEELKNNLTNFKFNSRLSSVFSTSKQGSVNLQLVMNCKIPKLRCTYKEYLYSTPKCDICNKTGMTIEELNKVSIINNQLIVDSLEYDYILYQCTTCKVYLHKNCAFEVNNFPNHRININSPSWVTWTCDKCKLNSNTIITCLICHKKDTQLKKSHFYKCIDASWVHSLCLLWFLLCNNLDESNLNNKLKQYNLKSNSCWYCYKCKDNTR
jgi:hypothetical protein